LNIIASIERERERERERHALGREEADEGGVADGREVVGSSEL
jgi:hypothetical protein